MASSPNHPGVRHHSPPSPWHHIDAGALACSESWPLVCRALMGAVGPSERYTGTRTGTAASPSVAALSGVR